MNDIARSGQPHPRWPGVDRGGSLVLPLRRDAFAHAQAPIIVEDIDFQPKAEWHVTLLNRRLTEMALRTPISGGHVIDGLRDAFDALDWRWRGTGERWLLREEAGGTVAHSIIELVDMPAFAPFRREAARLLGTQVPRAPAHVTLYVAGTTRGIGVDSEASFERLRVAPA
jgi:hypothetical protein